MPEIPPQFAALVDTFAGEVTEELMEAWTRGVCDGLDLAAQMAEEVLAHTDSDGAEHHTVRGLGLAMRHAQMHVQVDGLTDGLGQ